MAWVRYDDTFYSNPKVTRAIAEDPGALALHLLANTWTNAQKHPGFVPAHQPAILLCDRQRAADWAAVLVRSGLWHERDSLCAACAEEYADLPAEAVGYVFHNAREYRAPARDKTTPGTPAELSEKRRAAGRKGGLATAARREHEHHPEQANAANGASKRSNSPASGASPEPVPVPVNHPSDGLFAAASAAAPPKQKRATRIPDDFGITPEMAAWGKARMPHVNGVLETEKFVNYWQAKSGKDATKTDWLATWKNWMLSAAERMPTNGAGYRGQGVTESTAPKRMAADERCPTHPSFPKQNCGACRADRLAASREEARA